MRRLALITQIHRASLVWLLVVLTAFGATSTQASTSLSPVLLEIGQTDRTTLVIKNNSNRTIGYQLSLLAWKLENGQDQLTPSSELVLSPPVFTLAPGTSREIRMGFREQKKRPDTEQAFRVLVEELPDLSSAPAPGSQVQMTVKHLLPLYIAPNGLTPTPSLRWSAHQDGEMIRIRAENSGNRRVFIRELALAPLGAEGTRSTSPLTPKGRAVVLAKSWREWSIPRSGVKGQRWSLLITDQSGQVLQQAISLPQQ